MVNFSAKFLVVASLFASSLCTPLFKRDVAQVEADLTSIATSITGLDNAVNAFPAVNGTLLAALAIHTDAQNLATQLNNGTADVIAAGNFTVTDGTAILSIVQGVVPTIIDALSGIISKKASFEALPIAGIVNLVKSDISTLNSSTAALEVALIAAAPASLQATALGIQANVTAAFASAIAAYA